MTPLILHRVKNGFLVAEHNIRADLNLAEAFIAHDAAALVTHIEAWFSRPSPAIVMVPADAVSETLHAARSELADPAPAPAAEVQA